MDYDPNSTLVQGCLGVENIHIFQVVTKVGSLVRTKDSQGQADKGPDVYRVIRCPVMMSQVMDLGMAVMAAGNAVIGAGGDDLVIFQLAVIPPGVSESGLEKTAAAAAAVVI